MPPSLDAGVMRRTRLAAQRTSKAFALFKIQLQKQPAWFAFKSTLRYFPSRFELQGRRKQCFRCRRSYAVPPSSDLQGPAMRPLFLDEVRIAPSPRLALSPGKYRDDSHFFKKGRSISI
jgi:hypothetical protein